MKKSIFATLMAVVLTLGLASCTEKENDNTNTEPTPTVQELVIGSWQCTSAEIINPEDGESLEMEGTVFTFNADKTVSITSDGRTETGTYSVDKEDLIITVTMTEEGMTATVNMDVDVLEITKTNMTIEGKMDIIYQGQTLDSTKFKASFKKL
ncbi:MAG: DUF4923 family protein [Bacteroidales bacterium]|nr:DUF4923 family protein [Bacteroidales bacterium]